MKRDIQPSFYKITFWGIWDSGKASWQIRTGNFILPRTKTQIVQTRESHNRFLVRALNGLQTMASDHHLEYHRPKIFNKNDKTIFTGIYYIDPRPGRPIGWRDQVNSLHFTYLIEKL